MFDFPIKIKGIVIMSKEINVFLKQGKVNDAIQFIIEKTNCTPEEARDIVDDLINMIQLQNKKGAKLSNKNNVIQYDSKVKCPCCGSTQIEAVSRGYSFWTGFLGSGKTMNYCKACGHKWKP